MVEGSLPAELRLLGRQLLVGILVISCPRHLSNAGSRSSLLVMCGSHAGGGSTAQPSQESHVWNSLPFFSRNRVPQWISARELTGKWTEHCLEDCE